MTKPLRAADALGTLAARAAVIVVRGVETGASARWRPGTRAVTYTSPDAYEVSCRVRVGEVTRPEFPASPQGTDPEDGSPASAHVVGTSRGRWQSSASHPGVTRMGDGSDRKGRKDTRKLRRP